MSFIFGMERGKTLKPGMSSLKARGQLAPALFRLGALMLVIRGSDAHCKCHGLIDHVESAKSAMGLPCQTSLGYNMIRALRAVEVINPSLGILAAEVDGSKIPRRADGT